MKQAESRPNGPCVRCPHSRKAAALEEAKGEAGKSRWKETTGEAVPRGLSAEGSRVLGMEGQLLVTHKRITVVWLTLTLELLLKDGNRSRRLIKNAPNFPRRPWLMTIPKVPRGRNAMGSVKQKYLNFSSRTELSIQSNLPFHEIPAPIEQDTQ